MVFNEFCPENGLLSCLLSSSHDHHLYKCNTHRLENPTMWWTALYIIVIWREGVHICKIYIILYCNKREKEDWLLSYYIYESDIINIKTSENLTLCESLSCAREHFSLHCSSSTDPACHYNNASERCVTLQLLNILFIRCLNRKSHSLRLLAHRAE